MSLILVDALKVCGGGSRSEGEGGRCAGASVRGGATDNEGNRANSIRIDSSEAEDCAFACGNSLSVNGGASAAGYSGGGGGVTHGAEAEEGTSKRQEGSSKRAHLFGGASKVPRLVPGNTLRDAGLCGGGSHALREGGGGCLWTCPPSSSLLALTVWANLPGTMDFSIRVTLHLSDTLAVAQVISPPTL
jgi:hypothetical protein